ncbi:hypothetical protein J31TS4_42360 [Paenibacillus sp. J31TS4]|uniref:DUF1146 family protein n=1 Tax=Paenibacillus sp. J31TS4 TaxID=2807195 RepID=UPI001B222E62|nr:DUF1146 family protein [Paenibacillus sp. J31TS4]GIP40956.1 hypothetical protein J31TS4_42360 [Paenibacillus sp. J31TS4]
MDNKDSLAASLAIDGLTGIGITLVCIVLAWFGIQQLRLDKFIKQPKSPAGIVLQVFLSLALGYQVARFLLDYLSWSGMLKGMF